MKKSFDLIKHYIFFGLILSIIFAIFIPISASAAEEPTEGDQVVIPAGTYKFKDSPTFPNEETQLGASINFSLPNINNGEVEVYGNGISFMCGYGAGLIAHSFTTSADPNTNSVMVYSSDSEDGWDLAHQQYSFFPLGFGQTITVTADTKVDPTFATWFFSNTANGGDVVPDPEYTISAGWYLWQEELLGEFIPHTLTFNYRTFQRVGASGIPYYSYWSTMQFDNYVENDSYFSRLYYSSISNGRVLVYDDINGGWVDETYRRFYISSPLTLSAEDYFIFNAYTEYYGDTPPSFSGETVPSVPDPDSNIFTNIIGGVLDALDAFTIIGGFSLLDLITTLLGGMALIWILKLLAGG